MEAAQKKLTDEVARKIDNMSTAVSATAERAITTSGVTNALHTLIALVGGAPLPRTNNEGMAATEIAETGDAEHGKRATSAKAENQWGAKRQRGPQAVAAVRNPSVQDMLKQKWGAASRGAAPPGQPGSSSRSIPPGGAAPKPPGPAGATATVTSTSAAAAAAEGRQTTLTPARAAITAGNLHSALASASPIAASIEVKAEKRGRGGKKLPPPPVYTIDKDDADEELEGLVSRWVEAGDGGEQGGEAAVDVYSGGESADEQDGDPVIVEGGTTGGHGDTGPKHKGCGIRAPPRGGPGLVSEPHLGGKKRWLGHGDREDLQYKTAIAMWQRMFDSYRELTKPRMHTTNVIAWATVVGKEVAAEEADLGDVEPTDYAGAIACAIVMVWEVTRGSNVTAAADNGNLAARAAGCYGERSRLFPVVSAYVINAVRKRNRREEDEP
ncbi:unnamed protein product [Closterium sp. NIES-65]|nr:unnamed protein product [Closterium sp. NIES-65]